MRSATVVKALAVLGIVAAGIGVSGSTGAAAAVPSWHKVVVQEPSGSPYVLGFANMACPTKRVCWTAGQDTTQAGSGPVMERWHKKKFGLVRTAVANATLEGLSCPSARSCWVVGSATDASNHTSPVIEHWNGKRWSRVKLHNPNGDDNFLDDVSCPSTRRCYAVGGHGSNTVFPVRSSPLVERWNGKKWSMQKSPRTPAGATSGGFNAITCRTKSSCTAAGTYIPHGKYFDHVYVGVLRGKKWSLEKVPQPFHAQYAYAAATDLACPSAKRCVMSGSGAPDANGRTLLTAVAWASKGKSWKRIKLPRADAGTGSELTDTTCASAHRCWLVGYASSSGSQTAVALSWNGKKLHAAHVDQPATGTNELDATGCITSSRCLAVGDSDKGGSERAFGDRTG